MRTSPAPQEAGFRIGTNRSSLTLKTVYTNDLLDSASGEFTADVNSLSSSTTYYYQAFMTVYDGNGGYTEIVSTIGSFTTSDNIPAIAGGWLEMPSYTVSSLAGTTTSSLSDLYPLTHRATMGGKVQRNYSCLYDPEMYASYWVAYPLCSDHVTGSGRAENWAYDPDVPNTKQTDCISGAYGVSFATPNYASNLYSRGHQIANADRNGVAVMSDQTFYMTNITPQIQNGFNGGVWNNLEGAVQGLTSSCDTVYVITGAAFRKKGGSETVKTIVNTHDSKTIPVPNYYWKALLKVKRSGSTITGASAIGFWLPHQDLKGADYQDYTVSVKQIETWTGLDIFTNLPSAFQTSAETNTDWTTFRSY